MLLIEQTVFLIESKWKLKTWYSKIFFPRRVMDGDVTVGLL